MASGVNGSHGLNAHDLVAVEFKHVDARALNPAPLMEGKIASVAETRPGLATPTIAQVNYSRNSLLFQKSNLCSYTPYR